jgi:hypothetical protein
VYVLVLMNEVQGAESALTEDAREDFIDSLIARNLVLLGGPFAPRVGAATAARSRRPIRSPQRAR